MKKKLWFIGILLMSIFISSSKCSGDDEGHKYITFVNNSTNDIRVQERWQIQIELSDTILDSKVIPPLLIANKSSHVLLHHIRNRHRSCRIHNHNHLHRSSR